MPERTLDDTLITRKYLVRVQPPLLRKANKKYPVLLSGAGYFLLAGPFPIVALVAGFRLWLLNA